MLLEGALGDAANLPLVHALVAQLALGEPVGREVEVAGHLADDADVRVLGALRQAGELHVLDHAFPKFGHRDILQ